MKAITLIAFGFIALLTIVPLAFLPWLSFDLRLGVGGRAVGCFGGCVGGQVYVGAAWIE
jgi:hypothetical protein